QLRVRRGQHQPAQRRRRQRDQGLPELGDHHRQPDVVPEHSGIPGAVSHGGRARRGPDQGDRLVTATLDRPQPTRRARAPRVPQGPARRRTATTPTSLRTMLITLVLLSLAWDALGALAADEHSWAASAMVTGDEPLSLDAQQLYQ